MKHGMNASYRIQTISIINIVTMVEELGNSVRIEISWRVNINDKLLQFSKKGT